MARQTRLPPNLIRTRSWPSSRTAGGAPSPIWTTCASGMPANWTANEQRNDPEWPARGCPSWTTWSGRSVMLVTSPTRSSTVCGAFSNKRYRFSSTSAIRAMRRQGCPLTPSVTTQPAFRTLARKHPPGVNKDPAAEERFKEINEAYHVLSDPETRKRYDRFGEDFRKVPEDWEERVGAGAGGFQGGGFSGAGPSGARVRYGHGFPGPPPIHIQYLFAPTFA